MDRYLVGIICAALLICQPYVQAYKVTKRSYDVPKKQQRSEKFEKKLKEPKIAEQKYGKQQTTDLNVDMAKSKDSLYEVVLDVKLILEKKLDVKRKNLKTATDKLNAARKNYKQNPLQAASFRRYLLDTKAKASAYESELQGYIQYIISKARFFSQSVVEKSKKDLVALQKTQKQLVDEIKAEVKKLESEIQNDIQKMNTEDQALIQENHKIVQKMADLAQVLDELNDSIKSISDQISRLKNNIQDQSLLLTQDDEDELKILQDQLTKFNEKKKSLRLEKEDLSIALTDVKEQIEISSPGIVEKIELLEKMKQAQ